MPIVLHLPKREAPTRAEVLQAAAQAVIALCLDERAGDPESGVYQGLNTWYGKRVRKIARRARASAWQRVQQCDGVTVADRARACVPAPVNAVPKEIAKLQIGGTDLPHESEEAQRHSDNQEVGDTQRPIIWVDRSLNMSVGKAAAQVGHAVMHYAATIDTDTAYRWAQAGFPLEVREVPQSDWPAAENLIAAVRDAGLTEIAPGSLTVAVTF